MVMMTFCLFLFLNLRRAERVAKKGVGTGVRNGGGDSISDFTYESAALDVGILGTLAQPHLLAA